MRWGATLGRRTETKDILRVGTDGVVDSSTTYGFGRGGGAGTAAWSFPRAVKQGYDRNTWIWKGIDGIAYQAAKLFWGRRRWDDQDAPIDHGDSHPLVVLLNGGAPEGKINDYETAFQFRVRLSQQLLLSSRGAFVQVLSDRRGPTALSLLPPHRTRPRAWPVDHPNRALRGKLRDFLMDSPNPVEPPISLDPTTIRWVKNPHPESVWRSMTVLEALGLTVELDYFARVYARSFVLNDGRPGMMTAVEGDLTDEELDRLERKMGSGPTAAGRNIMVAGKLSSIDMARTPREADYQGTRKGTKDETLTGIGTPESVMGNASGRTFANADAEMEMFWTITMDAHLANLASAFHGDADVDYQSVFDLSKIDAFQRFQKEREDRARGDFTAGLISVDEFRAIVGRDPFDQPETRSLIIATQGKAFIPKDDADREALDALSTPASAPGAPGDQGAAPADQAGSADPPGGDTAGGGGGTIPFPTAAA